MGSLEKFALFLGISGELHRRPTIAGAIRLA
jgi:hypothetical protein